MQPFDAASGQSTLQLIRLAQAGDVHALDDLAARYLPCVRQIVSLRVGSQLRRHADIDDLVQDAIVRILADLSSYQPRTEGTFRNWLARCVENEVIDQARRHSSRKRGHGRVLRFADCDSRALHSTIFAGSEPAPSQWARAAETAERIREELLQMPEHQRELIILRTLCDMSYEDVALELGLPTAGAARVACSRALAQLRERIESRG